MVEDGEGPQHPNTGFGLAPLLFGGGALIAAGAALLPRRR